MVDNKLVANITHDAWVKMRGFIDLCPDEISGLGKVEMVEGEFYVTDIAIFTQVVSPTHSDIPTKALAQFQVELIRKGENPADWWCWWHSHAKMKPFFSETDKTTVEYSTDFDMLLSIVSNHAHEFYAQFDMHRPVRITQGVKVEVLEEENEEVAAWCQAEYAAKVTRPVYQAPAPYTRGVGFRRPLDDEWDDLPSKGGKGKRGVKVIDLDFPSPYADVKPGQKTVSKQSLEVNADDLAEYKAELAALEDELKSARTRGDGVAIGEISAEIYDKKVDGYYCGYEKQLPTKKL